LSAETHQQRRTEQRAHARRAILDASEAVLVGGGYERFSIRRVVARCGYTAPTIYHHFGDKDGLLDTLLEERFGRLARQLRRVPSGDDAVAYLRAMALAFVRFGLRHPTHYQLLFIPRAGEHAPPPSLEEVRERLEQAWTGLWEAGRLRAGDVEAAAQALWMLAHGLVSGHVQRPDLTWSKTLVEDAIDALLHGLVAPEPVPSRTEKDPS
jgi:AcrR family transcriptional regulator